MLFMLIFAGMSLKLRADQIVTGMAMNLIALGLTSTAFDALQAGHKSDALSVPPLKGLLASWSDVPIIGSILFGQSALTWLALLAVPLLWLYFEKTERGLELRAVGENPAAAQA